MKKLMFLLLSLTILFFMACGSNDGDDKPKIPENLVGTWEYVLPNIYNEYGEMEVHIEWTFNKNGNCQENAYYFINEFLDKLPDYPREFKCTATDTRITFTKLPEDFMFTFSGDDKLLIYKIDEIDGKSVMSFFGAEEINFVKIK